MDVKDPKATRILKHAKKPNEKDNIRPVTLDRRRNSRNVNINSLMLTVVAILSILGVTELGIKAQPIGEGSDGMEMGRRRDLKAVDTYSTINLS